MKVVIKDVVVAEASDEELIRIEGIRTARHMCRS